MKSTKRRLNVFTAHGPRLGFPDGRRGGDGAVQRRRMGRGRGMLEAGAQPEARQIGARGDAQQH